MEHQCNRKRTQSKEPIIVGITRNCRLRYFVQLRRGTWHIVLNLYNKEGKPKWINTGLPERGNKRNVEKLKDKYISQYEKKRLSPTAQVTMFTDYAQLYNRHPIKSCLASSM